MEVTRTYDALQINCNSLPGTVFDNELKCAIDCLLDEARANADETVYIEKSVPISQWGAMFIGSVQCLLSGDNPGLEVCDWFAKQGVEW